MNRKLNASLAAIAAIAVLMTSVVVGLTQGATNTSTSAGITTTTQSAAATGTSGLAASISASVCGEAKIPLGAAGNFEVLAGTTVTNTGATVVHGNLGVSPGSAVTGFPPGKVTGMIDKADTAAALAQKALVTAYHNGMGRTNCPVSVAGNIGGKTLAPGLYKSTSSLAISSGDLTLTAKGGSGTVFIFQVTSKLTVTSGRHVILAGGALASNIFWVVGSSATLGSTSVVYGNILAHVSISMATGATLHGKALANIGAVTLQGNTVAAVPVSIATISATASTLTPASIIARLTP
jgi:ice-binding like protein